MLDWLAQAPALVASLAVLVVPGIAIGLAAGLRGFSLWALAPAVSTGVLTAASAGLGLIGIGWRPAAAAIAVAILAVVVAGARFALRLGAVPLRRPDALRAVLLVGTAAGVVLCAVRLCSYIGDPVSISQTNDAAFHLSALRFAIDTGAASPLEIGEVIGSRSFYPSAWHVLASLVAQLSGAGIEVAANTVTVVVGAVAWPLGLALLTRVAAGTLAAALAAPFAGAVAAFPLLLVQWGVLYPQLLAVALLPAAVAVLADARALSAGEGALAARATRTALVAAVAAFAVAIAQPSVLLAWALAALAIAFWALVASGRDLRARTRAGLWAGLGAAVLATVVLWWYFSRSVSVTWPPTEGKGESILRVLTNAHLGYPPAIVVSVLALVGLVVAILRPRLRWIATVWLVLAGLYVVSAAVGSPALRGLLVGAWYEDPYRLAAMTPFVTVPLAGIGAAWITAWATRGGSVRSRWTRPAAWVSSGAVIVLAVGSFLAAPRIDRRDVFVDRVDDNLYAVTDDSFLSADELALLRRLDEVLPEGAVVIANPSTAASFGYALSGRDVIPRTWTPPAGSAYGVLWNSLRDVATDPQVCPALDAFEARYVLDFGPGEAYPGRWVMPGFTDLEGQSGFELVDREGDASLWRVTACD